MKETQGNKQFKTHLLSWNRSCHFHFDTKQNINTLIELKLYIQFHTSYITL